MLLDLRIRRIKKFGDRVARPRSPLSQYTAVISAMFRNETRRTARMKTSKWWSQRVTERSNALDLERGVFSRMSPRETARSLKRSAERSKRRKSDPYQSAMSMLSFYINRAGKQLSRTKRHKLEAAKTELRRLFGRDGKAQARGRSPTRARKARTGNTRAVSRKKQRKMSQMPSKKSARKLPHHGNSGNIENPVTRSE